MDLSASKKRSTLAIGGLLALTLCTGRIQAAGNVLQTYNTASPAVAITSVSVSCNTQTGTGAIQTFIVKALTAPATGHTITVTFTPPGGGLVVVAPSPAVITSTNTPLTYTVNTAPGCVANATNVKTIQFQAQVDAGSAAADVSLTVNDTVTVATASGLNAAPVTISCARSAGPTFVPGPAQNVSVTTGATGGIPFTVAAGYSAWLTLSSTSGGTAGVTPVIFTAVATSGCSALALGTYTTTVHLVATGGGPDALVTVTLLVVPPSPLTVTPVPAAPGVSLSYVKGSGTQGTANVSVTSSVAGAFFTVNTASMPIWLTVNTTSGTATAPLALSTTSVADSLAPGTYTATVYFKVSGYGDLGVPITLLVTNKAPKLTVSSLTLPISWTLGSAPPTASITAYSSDTPIQYSITTGGTLAPIVASKSGLAYSFGSQIPVTFNPSLFATAQPGNVLTGTVTFNWGSPISTTVVTISITVVSPGATLTSISPATLPTGLPGQSFQISITGSGFVAGSDPNLRTRVGLLSGGAIVPDTNFSVFVQNPSNLVLTITIPNPADPNLPFAPGGVNGVVGGPVYIGLVNGLSTTPNGPAMFTIGAGPIIQGVTSASSFVEVTAPTLPTIAPYDMISIFGSNFCSAGVSTTNCGSSTLLSNAPDALTARFGTTLSNDPAGNTQRVISVSFYQHGTTTLIANAPLLFATNSQINAIVPAGVSGYVGSNAVDLVVNFGYGSGATLLSSSPFAVNIANTDPGIFTVGSDGQGAGAALNLAYNLIGSTNPAGMRTGAHTANDSDTIQLYVTGLGVPGSSADNTTTGGGAVPTDCIGTTSGTGNFMSTLQAATSVSPALTSIDGAVLQSSLLKTGRIVPCLTTNPVVKIGGVSGTVTYAGFVPDTVAGLYQINVKLPASTGVTLYPNYPLTTNPITTVTQPVQLPVHVTLGGNTSQNNVNIWVAPRLLMVGPAVDGNGQVDATVGTVYSGGGVTAYEGNGTYVYSISSGVLPSGLTLNTSTGAITGTPNAGTGGIYPVTISATDTATIPVTGTYPLTFNVAGALIMTMTGSSPFNSPAFGTVAPYTDTTITATGGTVPYTYAITTPSPVPAGMAISTTGVVTTSATTPAGVYNGIVVTATDSSSTPLTGTATFRINVPLQLTTVISPTPQTNGSGLVLYQVNAAGNTGAVTYTLQDVGASGATALHITGSTGAVDTGSAAAGTYTFTVTATDSGMAPGATAVATGITGTITVVVQ
jgi:uncharacterized protein (TIGR03437 family)